MRTCLESSTMSILVNGSPTQEFKPQKGLRQEDSLAPFLFLIVADDLTGVIRQAETNNMLDNVEVGDRQMILCSSTKLAHKVFFW